MTVPFVTLSLTRKAPDDRLTVCADAADITRVRLKAAGHFAVVDYVAGSPEKNEADCLRAGTNATTPPQTGFMNFSLKYSFKFIGQGPAGLILHPG